MTFTGVPANPEFNNLPIGTIPGATLERQVLDACQGCALASSLHKCFKRILVAQGGEKAAVDESIRLYNELADAVADEQAQVNWMHIIGCGINNDYTNLYESPSANMSIVAMYDLVAAGAGTATLRLAAGDISPRAIYSALQLGPYGMSMMPIGIMTIGAPSLICFHGGFRICGLGLTQASYSTGDTFTVRIDGNASAATTKFPSSSTDQIRVVLRFYDVPERWIDPEPFVPLFYKDESELIVSVDSLIENNQVALAAGLIVPPDAADEYFSCEGNYGGTWEDVTGVVRDGVVSARSGSYCVVNVGELGAATQLRFHYYAYDATGWKIAGIAHCANCRRDRTGSYGVDGWYCACGIYASGYSTFTAKCYNTACDHFSIKQWDGDNLSRAVAQLLVSTPWMVYRGLNGMEAQRIGAPSWASLTGTFTTPPVGPSHTTIYLNTDTGKWPQIDTSGMAIAEYFGLNVKRVENVLIGIPSTWGGPGPAALNTKSDYLDQALDDDNDRHRVGRSMPMRSQDDIHAHTAAVVDNFGYYQTFRDAWLYAPKLHGPVTAGPGFKFETVMLDEFFNATTNEEDAVYFWRLQILDHVTSDKTRPTDPGQELYPKVNVDRSAIAGGDLVCDLRNRAVTASSQDPHTSYGERETTWLTGGGWVPPHENLRLINWLSWLSYWGPMRSLIWPGMCAVVRGRRYWIKKTSPMTGSTSSWIPYDYLVGSRIRGKGCCWWQPFLSNDEVLDNVLVYDALAQPRDKFPSATRPYAAPGAPLGALPLNSYWFEQYELNGQRGALIYFSQLNLENWETRQMDIWISTNQRVYHPGEPVFGEGEGVVRVDIKTHPTQGTDYVWPFVISLPNVPESITSVQVQTRQVDSSGQFVVHTLTPGPFAQPTAWKPYDYYATFNGSQVWLWVHSQWAYDQIIVKIKSEKPADEGQFYTDYIAFHPNKPADYQTYGNKRDQITLVNENGALDAVEFAGGEDDTIAITYDGKASPEKPTVYSSRFGAAGHTQINAANIAWFGAEGVVYGKTRHVDGTCLAVNYKGAERICVRLDEELNHLAEMRGRVQG